jgi:4-amino-4-deoxy-L-arabinose transferase-like glycosyltransferase
MEKRDIFIVVALFFVAFLIRASSVAEISMYPDEWIYWTDMHRILASNFYVLDRPELFNYTSPFYSSIGAATTPVFGNDLNTIRMLSVLFGSMTVPFLYFFGKEIYNRKTGLLAAILFCFSTYHSLYSRIIMLEATAIFFITASVYFFWRTQHPKEGQKRWISAILSGAMMGLAIDVKYAALFLVPAIIGYILWTTRFNFRALFDKKILIVFFCAFLFFLPLLFCLFYTGVGFHGMFYYSMEKYQKSGAQTRLSSLPITEIAQRALDTVTGVFAWGSDKLSPSGEMLFNLSVTLLLFITVVFYLFCFAKREKEGTFLIISVFLLHILFFVISPYKHYYTYTLPFYYVMISHVIFTSTEKKNGTRSIVGICVALLAVIVVFFYIYMGATSPVWDKGEYVGAENAIYLIKNDAYSSNKTGTVLIGTTFREVLTEYAVHKQDFSAANNRMIELTDKYAKTKYQTNLQKINQLQPDYFIFTELTYSRFYFKTSVENNLMENYRIIRDEHQYFLEYIILKRVTPSTRQNMALLYNNETKGVISKRVFQDSIPSVMVIGKSYPMRIQVTNTGKFRTEYYLASTYDKFRMYVDKPVRASIVLNPGETGTVTYSLVPFAKYSAKDGSAQYSDTGLPVIVDLYTIPTNLPPEAARDPDYQNWARQEMDTAVAFVSQIT